MGKKERRKLGIMSRIQILKPDPFFPNSKQWVKFLITHTHIPPKQANKKHDCSSKLR